MQPGWQPHLRQNWSVASHNNYSRERPCAYMVKRETKCSRFFVCNHTIFITLYPATYSFQPPSDGTANISTIVQSLTQYNYCYLETDIIY